THAIIGFLIARSFRVSRPVWLSGCRSLDADLTAHRRVPITEVGIDTRLTEADSGRGAACGQAHVEAPRRMLGVAGRHAVLDVVPVGPRDAGPGVDLDGARLELEELNVDCRNRLGRRNQRGYDHGQCACRSDHSVTTHCLVPPSPRATGEEIDRMSRA